MNTIRIIRSDGTVLIEKRMIPPNSIATIGRVVMSDGKLLLYHDTGPAFVIEDAVTFQLVADGKND